MFGFSPSDVLIDRARALTGQELAVLAKATRRSIGIDLFTYLGLRSKNFLPYEAASAALKNANRADEMRAKGVLLSEALLTAAVTASSNAGRDSSGVLEAW